MWVVCKKRKIIKQLILKRKLVNGEYNNIIKKQKFVNHLKRKSFAGLEKKHKKQKIINAYICLIHEQRYICDVYDCGGIKKIYHSNHMPYII